jgi:hypothetical protein
MAAVAAIALCAPGHAQGTKISALSNAGALSGTEKLPAVQGAGNVNVTPAQIATYVSGNLGAASGTSINVSSASAPFQYGGNVILRFPIDGTGEYGTYLGYRAGYGTDGGGIHSFIVTCIGAKTCGAGGSGMTGVENTLGGWASGYKLTTGGFNTAWGVNTLGAETTGFNNVAIAVDAMRNSTGVDHSIAIGSNAMRDGTNTDRNVAIGIDVMKGQTSTSSVDTVAIGWAAMSSTSLSSASRIVAIGKEALKVKTSGSDVVAIGNQAGKTCTSCATSVLIGPNVASTTLDTGSGNILIGTSSAVDTASAGTSNYLSINNVITATGINAPSSSLTSIAGGLALAQKTVATLPTCNSGAKGGLFVVTDANAPSWHGTLSGGGSAFSGAMCDGTNWIAF